MFVPQLTEVLNSGLCSFYCLCQTYSQTWSSFRIFHILLSTIKTPLPFCPLFPHSHSPLTLFKKKKNHLVCCSSFVSRENQQIIFSVLNKLLYFDIREYRGYVFFLFISSCLVSLTTDKWKEQCGWLSLFLWQDARQNSFRKERFILALGEGTVHRSGLGPHPWWQDWGDMFIHRSVSDTSTVSHRGLSTSQMWGHHRKGEAQSLTPWLGGIFEAYSNKGEDLGHFLDQMNRCETPLSRREMPVASVGKCQAK